MIESKTLAGCPLCKSGAVVEGDSAVSIPGYYRIRCSSRKCKAYQTKSYYSDLDVAIDRWNSRLDFKVRSN